MHYTYALNLKDHHPETGWIAGYASVFNIVDQQKDVIKKGAFSADIARWREGKSLPKMLWQHDPTSIIGRWQKIEENEHGLYVEGQLFLDLQKGFEAYTLLKQNVLDGLSIGFKPISKSSTQKYREITDLELYEISLVTFAANPNAKILDHKNLSLLESLKRATSALSY